MRILLSVRCPEKLRPGGTQPATSATPFEATQPATAATLSRGTQPGTSATPFEATQPSTLAATQARAPAYGVNHIYVVVPHSESSPAKKSGGAGAVGAIWAFCQSRKYRIL